MHMLTFCLLLCSLVLILVSLTCFTFDMVLFLTYKRIIHINQCSKKVLSSYNKLRNVYYHRHYNEVKQRSPMGWFPSYLHLADTLLHLVYNPFHPSSHCPNTMLVMWSKLCFFFIIIRARSICPRCTAAFRLIVRPLSPHAPDAPQPLGLLWDPCPPVIFRRSHFSRQVPPHPYDARDPSSERWNCGRECWPVILPKCQIPRFI
jgi:hypothetical protein